MFQEVPYHMVEINPISGAVVQDPNEACNVLGSLKHFYIFGRFLGLTLWLGHLLGVHLGSTILGPLRGPAHFPGLSFEHFKHLTDRTEVLNEKIDNDSTYSVLERIFTELEKACKQSGTSKETLQKVKSDFLLGNNAPNELYYRAPGVYYEYTLQTPDEDPETLSEIQRALKLDAIRKECSDFLSKTSFLPQANAIRNGFKDVLPLEWLRLFTEDELRLLLGGETIIDPAEFAQTVCIAQISDESLINCDITEIDWQHFGADFLETLVEEVTDDASFGKRFLVSLTGRTVPPPGGMAAISPPITVSTTPFNLHAYSCTHSLYLPELFIRLYFEGSMTMNDIFKDIKKLGTEFTIA